MTMLQTWKLTSHCANSADLHRWIRITLTIKGTQEYRLSVYFKRHSILEVYLYLTRLEIIGLIICKGYIDFPWITIKGGHFFPLCIQYTSSNIHILTKPVSDYKNTTNKYIKMSKYLKGNIT